MFVRSQENNNKSEFHNCISPERHQDITKKADHITIVTIKFEKNAYDRYFCCRVVLAPSADNIRLLLNKQKFYVEMYFQLEIFSAGLDVSPQQTLVVSPAKCQIKAFMTKCN